MLDALRAKREGHVNTEHISIENKKQNNKTNKKTTTNKEQKQNKKTDKQALFTVHVTLLMFEEGSGGSSIGAQNFHKERKGGRGAERGEGGGQKWKAEMRKAEFLAVGHMLFFLFFFPF